MLDPKGHSPPGPSVRGISQERIALQVDYFLYWRAHQGSPYAINTVLKFKDNPAMLREPRDVICTVCKKIKSGKRNGNSLYRMTIVKPQECIWVPLAFHCQPTKLGGSFSYPPILKTVVNFTIIKSHNKINHFKVNNSVAFSTVTILCNHHLYIDANSSHHPKRKPCSHYAFFLQFLATPHSAPGNHQPAVCLYGFTSSRHFTLMESHIGDFLCLVSLT